jgi:hypothetical protein
MTTIVLQAAGTAIGSFFGGPLGAMAGRALGAVAGGYIDGQLFGEKQKARTIEGPRLREMEGLASQDGAPIPKVYGRVRIGGQLIWATRFEERATTTIRKAASSGGKGAPSRPASVEERSYSYSVNLAIGLCEGPIALVRRVWADGREVDLTRVTMRVYTGDQAQQPDALIVAKEGAGQAPAYRGTAYVVFERFPLASYGNRVPQFSFEVVRALPGLGAQVRSVNLVPGSSEFAYEPANVTRPFGMGSSAPENRHQLQAGSDVIASLDQLQALCPGLTSVQIVVSWFGDDLRAGQCTVAPRVDSAIKVTSGATWGVAGLLRADARLVTLIEGRPAYGGTPSDAAVLALIAEVKRRGLKVVLYPFLMMDIGPANALPNPSGGASQPAFPWRGRMTCNPAPGQPASADGTATAAAQVAAFVGTVGPADLALAGSEVVCAKPAEWSFRRHILHYARLAGAAGGVDGFIIGSEMVGLSRVRSASGVYPFVSALQSIADDARAMLGPSTRITYAADWTEYGAHVLDGGDEMRFPLDPLWASPAISAVGIDYYPPVSDWRDGVDHADAAMARSAHDLAYLAGRQQAGEAFDWFYASPAARAAQTRSAITDGAYGKPWIYRPKDLAGWWANAHVERVGGVERPAPTAWQPGSKPLWLTEIGCPAVDKGANAPNVFPDAKSSESARPFFSDGSRDDLALLRAVEAQVGVLDPASALFRPAANPVMGSGPQRMIDPDDIAVWAWDARPFPAFPMLEGVWSDGENWHTGHWLNGRLEAAPLDALVAAILADYEIAPATRLEIDHVVEGYVIDRPMSAREALEPLTRLFALDAGFDQGRLTLRGRSARPPHLISPDDLVPDTGLKPFSLRRAQETELPRELRIGFIDGAWDYLGATSRSRRLAGAARREVSLEAPLVASRAQIDRLADMRLKDAWIGRETLTLQLSPRQIALEPGDTISFSVDGLPRLFRVTEVADAKARRLTAVSTERAPAAPVAIAVRPRPPAAPALAGVPFAVALELPGVRGSQPVLQHLAVHAAPWPGVLDVLRSAGGVSFEAVTSVRQPALVGRLLGDLEPGPLWRWDQRNAVEITVESGDLQSVSDLAALDGANTFAIEGPDGQWELLSAARIDLTGPRTYRLSRLLRGLAGSEPAAAQRVSAGALVIGVDEALVPLTTALSDLGRELTYRVVPSGLDAADPSVLEIVTTARGLALKPLAPVHLRARRGAGGIALGWTRRSRIDGDNWELADPPLGEAFERYQVEIFDGVVRKRSLVTSEPAWLYSTAAELADFGSARSTLDIAIAQISETAGPGFVRRGIVRVH